MQLSTPEPVNRVRSRAPERPANHRLLFALTAMLWTWAGLGRAQDARLEASVRSLLYQDDDRTTIVTTSADANGRIAENWRLGTRYLIDVVSSASVDVVSQATGAFEDIRHEVGADVAFTGETGLNLKGGYAYSNENDWRSHNVSVSGGGDVLDRTLNLSAALALQENDIFRSDTFGFVRDQDAYLGSLSATYIATPRDLLHATLSLGYYDGFLASPYRYLTIRTRAYAEEVPDHRLRSGLVLRHHRDLEHGFALRSHLRLYLDTFGVKALTAGSELAFEAKTVELTAWVRAYGQLAAGFYREVYATQQRYMTLDKELSSFFDAFVGGSFRWSPGGVAVPGVDLHLQLAGFLFKFFNFAALENRFGFTATLGATVRL